MAERIARNKSNCLNGSSLNHLRGVRNFAIRIAFVTTPPKQNFFERLEKPFFSEKMKKNVFFAGRFAAFCKTPGVFLSSLNAP